MQNPSSEVEELAKILQDPEGCLGIGRAQAGAVAVWLRFHGYVRHQPKQDEYQRGFEDGYNTKMFNIPCLECGRLKSSDNLPKQGVELVSLDELEREAQAYLIDLSLNNLVINGDRKPYIYVSDAMAKFAQPAVQIKFPERILDYVEHEQNCIAGQCRAGQPTEDGGYETLYGHGLNERWYKRGEKPECSCGLDEAIDEFKRINKGE